MAHSNKKYTVEKIPKTHPTFGRRTKIKQTLKDFVNGKLDEDDLDFLDDEKEAGTVKRIESNLISDTD